MDIFRTRTARPGPGVLIITPNIKYVRPIETDRRPPLRSFRTNSDGDVIDAILDRYLIRSIESDLGCFRTSKRSVSAN